VESVTTSQCLMPLPLWKEGYMREPACMRENEEATTYTHESKENYRLFIIHDE
jgi:hypothetical protein